MGILESIVLGAVQGLTEFLPVSSDGHLAVAYRLFGSKPNLTFEVFLHAATLLALLVYFWRDILRLLRALGPKGKGSGDRRLVWLILLATAISGVLAVVLKKVVEAANESLPAIGAGFLVTATVLAAAEYFARRAKTRDPDDLGYGRAAAIGVAQAAAVLPGVSRSGSTISAGMLFGLDREQATRFSFLLGIPIIAAAVIFELPDILGGEGGGMPPIAASLAGFVAAGAAGYAAIRGLLALVRSRSLYAFSVYTAVVGLAVIMWGVLA